MPKKERITASKEHQELFDLNVDPKSRLKGSSSEVLQNEMLKSKEKGKEMPKDIHEKWWQCCDLNTYGFETAYKKYLTDLSFPDGRIALSVAGAECEKYLRGEGYFTSRGCHPMELGRFMYDSFIKRQEGYEEPTILRLFFESEPKKSSEELAGAVRGVFSIFRAMLASCRLTVYAPLLDDSLKKDFLEVMMMKKSVRDKDVLKGRTLFASLCSFDVLRVLDIINESLTATCELDTKEVTGVALEDNLKEEVFNGLCNTVRSMYKNEELLGVDGVVEILVKSTYSISMLISAGGISDDEEYLYEIFEEKYPEYLKKHGDKFKLALESHFRPYKNCSEEDFYRSVLKLQGIAKSNHDEKEALKDLQKVSNALSELGLNAEGPGEAEVSRVPIVLVPGSESNHPAQSQTGASGDRTAGRKTADAPSSGPVKKPVGKKSTVCPQPPPALTV